MRSPGPRQPHSAAVHDRPHALGREQQLLARDVHEHADRRRLPAASLRRYAQPQAVWHGQPAGPAAVRRSGRVRRGSARGRIDGEVLSPGSGPVDGGTGRRGAGESTQSPNTGGGPVKRRRCDGWRRTWSCRMGSDGSLPSSCGRACSTPSTIRPATPPALQEALKAYGVARTIWAETAAQVQDVYVHDITFGLEKQLRGHWLDRLAAIDEDIADMQKRAQNRPSDAQTNLARSDAMRCFLSCPDGPATSERLAARVSHTPPPPFRPGQPVTVELTLPDQQPAVTSVRLYYRQVHQALPYHVVDMPAQGNRCSANYPGRVQ